jgi:hypothetical protein
VVKVVSPFLLQKRGDIMNSKWIRYTARGVALAWASLWTMFGLMSGIGEGLDPVGVFMHTLVPGLIFLIAAIIAWRWELFGGLLLVAEGLLTMATFPFATTSQGFMLLAFPPIVAGCLFLADALFTRTGTTPTTQ